MKLTGRALPLEGLAGLDLRRNKLSNPVHQPFHLRSNESHASA